MNRADAVPGRSLPPAWRALAASRIGGMRGLLFFSVHRMVITL